MGSAQGAILIARLVAEATASAAVIEHPWDVQALDWPLTTRSVVVEVGGYKGRWALQIAERYSPMLFVFEPQSWAADVCRAVLGRRANVYAVALGDQDATLPMGDFETDGCSFTKPGASMGQMREIRGMFDQCQITKRIDLMLMNIEGYEYTLIPHMLSVGVLPERLMVQCHGDMIDHIPGYRVLWTYGAMLTAWVKI